MCCGCTYTIKQKPQIPKAKSLANNSRCCKGCQVHRVMSDHVCRITPGSTNMLRTAHTRQSLWRTKCTPKVMSSVPNHAARAHPKPLS